MKHARIALVVIFILSITVVSFAQSVDSVINRAVEAMGGAAKLDAINSMKMVISGSAMGMDMNMTMYKKGNKSRQEVNTMGMDMIMATDGEDYWMSMSGEVMDMMDQQKQQLESGVDNFTGSGLKDFLKKAGAEYVGKEAIDSGEAHAISFSLGDQGSGKMYFNVASGLPVMVKMTTPMGEIDMMLTDYKEVGGIKFAHKFEGLMGGAPMMTLTVTDIQINPAVDDALFKRP